MQTLCCHLLIELPHIVGRRRKKMKIYIESINKNTYKRNLMNISKHSLTRKKINPSLIQGVFFTLTIFISSYCYAGIYKWVDDEGNIHYGQQRPASAKSEKMRIQHHAPNDSSTYKRPGAKEGEENKEEKASETAKDKKKPETAAEKKRRMVACAQAKKNLQTMQSVGRIRSKDKDGNASYISQEQKEAKMKQSRELINKHCK